MIAVWDLVIASFVLAALSTAALWAGWRVARQWSWAGTLGLNAIVLTSLLVFVFRLHGTWHMARVVPFSGAVILANWIPIGGAYFAGVTLGQAKSPLWRRGSLAGLIGLLSVYSIVCCFQGKLPLEPPAGSRTIWSQQERRSSCGPCCAALLLRHHGIDATEKEMLRLCLTSHRGCPALGLYRGLKLKTAGTDWDVEVVSCTVEELMDMRGPLLLHIAIRPMMRMDSKSVRMERKTYQHAVLLMGVSDCGRAEIVDPAVMKDWFCYRRADELREEWLGEALRLAPRRGTSVER